MNEKSWSLRLAELLMDGVRQEEFSLIDAARIAAVVGQIQGEHERRKEESDGLLQN